MYDSLSLDYDRFVNWQNRLSIELPFIIKQFQLINAKSILDVATGTGMHAIALAQLGY
jgi:ubiquinone/menaquinone biosynthesis C-methylase UbiE